MNNTKYIYYFNEQRKYLKRGCFGVVVHRLRSSLPNLLPWQYNALLHEVTQWLVNYLFRMQHDRNSAKIRYDDYHVYLSLPAYYEQPDKPICSNCKFNIVNINEKNLFEYEEQNF